MDPAHATSEEKRGFAALSQETSAFVTEKIPGGGFSAASTKGTTAASGVGVSKTSTLSVKPGSTMASAGAKSGLPAYVVACNNLQGRTRYGVKIKIPGRKGQMRVGSAFADPESASLAANVFQKTASIDAQTGDIQLNPQSAALYEAAMCSIFKARSVNMTQMSVVAVLQDILQKRTARIKTRKAKRKRAGSSPSPSPRGGARADNEAVASASGARLAFAPAAEPARASAAAGSVKPAPAAAKLKAAEGSPTASGGAADSWFPASGFLGPISGAPSGSGDSAAIETTNGHLSPLHSLTSREIHSGFSARNGAMSFSPSNANGLASLLSSKGGGEAAGASWLDSGKGANSQNDLGRPKSLDRIDRIESALISLTTLNPTRITVGTSAIIEARGSNFTPSTNVFATTLDDAGCHRREMLQTWRSDDSTRCMFEVHGIDPGTYHVYASNDLATFSNLIAFEVAV